MLFSKRMMNVEPQLGFDLNVQVKVLGSESDKLSNIVYVAQKLLPCVKYVYIRPCTGHFRLSHCVSQRILLFYILPFSTWNSYYNEHNEDTVQCIFLIKMNIAMQPTCFFVMF